MSNLTNNTDELNKILAAVNALPDAGGGGITPSGTIQITENGTHDVTEYAYAEVNVPSSGGGTDERFTQLVAGTLTSFEDSTTTKFRDYAFYYLASLQTLRASALTAVPTCLCQNATGLVTVDLPNATGRMGNNAFQKCTSLRNVNIPKITNFVNYAFSGCTALEKLDLSSNFVGFSGGVAFGQCSNLTALILRKADKIVTLGNKNNFDSSAIANGTGYIYVPAALVDSYKTATNWSNFAAQFRAIEDYPDITGG